MRYTVPNIGNVIEMRLTRVVRGAEAETIVNKDKSIMPATLNAGEEFYAVYAEVTHVDQHGGLEALPIASPVGWSAIVDEEMIDAATIVMMQDQLLSSGLRPDETLAGWIPFRIPIGSQVSQLHFSLNDTMPGVWFALKD